MKPSENSPSAPVAIIGVGCLFPQAEGAEAYWSNIHNKVDSITGVPATHWLPEDYLNTDPKAPDQTYTARGAFLSPIDFNPLEFGISPKDIEATDTIQLLGLVVAKQALQDAGYWPESKVNRERVSVILGVTGTLELVIPLGARLGHPIWRRALKEAGVENAVAEEVVQRISDSYVGWQENSFPGLLGNVVAGRIANRLNLGGTNCVVDAACASSLSALHLASLELSTGKSDIVVTGGLDAFNDIFMFMCFSKTPALSPTGDAKPFDSRADGTILGEGMGILVVKRLEDAERDNDKIYAVVRGIGSSSDGRGNAIYAPCATGQAQALREAYLRAGISPDTVELVEAHGTGTKVGDAIEVAGLTEVYRAARKEGVWCALGSVKSQIGHTKAAAGAAGLIKAALALHKKVLPPTLKVSQPIEVLASGETPFYVNTEKRPWLPPAGHPRRAAVSSFGFGGSNFHCVLEEYASTKAGVDWDGIVQILSFSAQEAGKLMEEVSAFPTDLSWQELRRRAGLSRSRFNPAQACRLHVVVERGRTELPALLSAALARLQQQPEMKSWALPEGVFFGAGKSPGRLAFLFPGQGSQYVGMLRDLACQFPHMQEALAEADKIFADGGKWESGQRLSDFIYPHSIFDEKELARKEEALRATPIAQPALGAVSLGGLRILEEFGLHADAAAGHSYGELTALCAAGRFSAQTLFSLSRLRGRLMAEGQGDRGAMLAVQAPLEKVDAVLREESLDLILANKNAPNQAVLSGRTPEIDRAAEAFSRRQIGHKRLPVSAAFHSPLVAEARAPFRAALSKVSFSPARFPVFANSTAQEYPDSPDEAAEILASQLARPVEFVSEIENLYRSGARTFLEIGPGARLTGLVRAILGGREHSALALDSSSGKRSGMLDLARVLAQLSALGHEIKLELWDGGPARPTESRDEKKPAMTIPLCGANYVHPKPPQLPIKVKAAPAAPATPMPLPATDTSAPPQATALPPATSFAEALRITQENLAALQRYQEQTAQIHRRFLEGQEAVQRSFQALVEQQQRWLEGCLGLPARAAPLTQDDPPTRPLVAAADEEAEREGRASSKDESTLPAKSGRPSVTAPRQAVPTGSESAKPRPPEISQPDGPGPSTSSGPPAAVENGFERGLLEIVAEKTGYPVEMLELDMELDSDLGIDSIKRVEILAALQDRFTHIPEIKSENLGDFRTLRNVLDFLNRPTEYPEPQNPAASPPGPGPERVRSTLLQVVSEKTGYPVEMLDLDMEMDADLGIDSIKRVEILSALEEQLPGMPEIKSEHLGAFHSLRQVFDFLARDFAGQPEPPREPGPIPVKATPAPEETPASLPVAPPSLTPSDSLNGIQRSALRCVPLEDRPTREKFGLPPGSEIWITDSGSELASALAQSLSAMNYAPRVFSPEDLAGLERPSVLGGLVILSPAQNANDFFLKKAFKWIQFAAPGLREAGRRGAAMLVTVSRLDGEFGLNGLHPHNDPASGGLAGLVKTAHHEWPEVHCKALDVAPGLANLEKAVSAILEEMFQSLPVEVGVSDKGRHTLELLPSPLRLESGSAPLGMEDVVVVSGGARGITARVALALARAFQPALVLLGRSPAPGPEPDWLAGLVDETEIKKAIGLHSNGKDSLRSIGERYRACMVNREMLRNFEEIKAAGSKLIYRSMDVRDASAVQSTIHEIRETVGPIRGLIHGAGVLADRRIEDKTEVQFELVYDTKVSGLRNLIGSLADDDLRILVLFSSTTARFGRTGQVDYAAANEVLNKIAQQQSRMRPGCRVLSLNWGPWEGGMVTPSLRKIFEKEGVGLIPLDAGADYLVQELRRLPGQPVEMVILGSGSRKEKLEAPRPDLWTPAFERTLDLEQHPFLKSHVMDGRAVLPLAMIVEWFAHGAMHGNPGLAFHGFDELRVFRGVVLETDEPYTIQVLAGKAHKQDGFFVVPVDLRGLPSGSQPVVHARSNIILASRLPEDKASLTPMAMDRYPHPAEAIYNNGLLFHGPDLQGIERILGCSGEGIVAEVMSAPKPSCWLKQPLRGEWVADPLVLDSSFQMMILWSFERYGAGSLPCFVGRYRQFQRLFPKDGVRIVVQVTQNTNHRGLANIEFLDRAGNLVARMESYECVIDASLNPAFRSNRLSPQRTP